MGMEQTVIFPGKPVPSWTAARDLLAARGLPLQMRMIDGQLAFPDEEPPEPWSELRFNLPGGMVTVRREGERLVFVAWGNADDTQRPGMERSDMGVCRSRRRRSADGGGKNVANRISGAR